MDVRNPVAWDLGWGVLVNALEVAWDGNGPSVQMSIFGGRLLTTSAFTGPQGIVTVRPNAVVAEPLTAPGSVESVAAPVTDALPVVAVVDRVSEAGAALPIEEARVIVAGGRTIETQAVDGAPALLRTWRISALDRARLVGELDAARVAWRTAGTSVDVDLGSDEEAADLLARLAGSGARVTAYAPLHGAMEAAYLAATEERR